MFCMYLHLLDVNVPLLGVGLLVIFHSWFVYVIYSHVKSCFGDIALLFMLIMLPDVWN